VEALKKSANRWVPRSRQKKEVKLAPDGTELFDMDDLALKGRSLLNKLTLENFEPITTDLINLCAQSRWEEDAKSLKEILALTFAKATDEPHWSSMYAQFCATLVKTFSDSVLDKTSLDKNNLPIKGGFLVRRCLLLRCQTEYEKGWANKIPTNPDGTQKEFEMMSEEYYTAAKEKRRGLGLVKFIGELFGLGLLSNKVIVKILLDQSNPENPAEDVLENLIQLVKTTGEILESTPGIMDNIFKRIQFIIESANISSRVRFLLQDLVDLRRSRWKSSELNQGPKTISQIHADEEEKRRIDEKEKSDRRRLNTNTRSFSNR
ncbi:MIF4G domain-containing protein, partial [Ascoidea rubescens DSM 1968]